MIHLPRHGERLLWRFLMTCFLIAGPMMTGCASSDRGERVTIHEGPEAAVVLEPLTAANPARHPVAMDATVVDGLLRAVHVQQEERLLQRLLTGAPPPVRVFSDDQIRVLTPLLVTAFSRAKTNQQVRFRLAALDAPVQDATQGALYVLGPSLYVTLLQYPSRALHVPQDRPGRQPPDPTGLQGRRLVFLSPGIPGDDDDRVRLAEERPPATLVIDYARLKQVTSRTMPRPSATRDGLVKANDAGEISAPSLIPIQAEPHDGRPASGTNASRPQQNKVPDSGSLHELIVRKDLEIEALKDELRQLRQAYDLQQQELKRLKLRKRQESVPSR
jgi:hypothetical protein